MATAQSPSALAIILQTVEKHQIFKCLIDYSFRVKNSNVWNDSTTSANSIFMGVNKPDFSEGEVE